MTSRKKLSLREKYEESYCHEPFYTGGVIQWTEDGQYMACACDGAGLLLSVDTGQQVKKITYEEDSVTAVIVSPQAKHVVTAHKSGLLRHWTMDGELVRTWKCLHTGPIARLSFDPTGTLLATGGSDSSIKVWDLEKQYCTHNLRGSAGVFSVVTFHPDPTIGELFGCADDTTIRVWDLISSTVKQELKGHFSTVTALCFSEDKQIMYSCGRDKVVIVWDLSTGSVKQTIPVYESLEALILLPGLRSFPELDVPTNAQYLVAAGEMGILRVISTITWKEVVTVKCGKQRITQLSVVGEDRLATVSEDDVITLRDFNRLKIQKQWVGHHGEILDMAIIGEDENYLALATNGCWLCVYHVPTLTCQLVEGHTDTIMAITVWASDPGLFATASKDHTVRVWRLSASGSVSCVCVASGHTAHVTAVAASLTKVKYLITGSQDTTLKRWEMPSSSNEEKSLTCSYTEVAHDGAINSVAVSPNDKIIATGSQDHTAKLWSKNLRLLGVLRGHRRGVWCVKFSPVDQVLATSSADSIIRLWSISDFTCVKTLEGHGGSVLRLLFISRGMQLLSSGSDGLIRLWTIKSSECTLTLDRHTDRLWSLAVKENEEVFFSGGTDSRIVQWKNVTEMEREKKAQEEDKLILQQQELDNMIHEGRVSDALGVAIVLRQPNTALKILNDILVEGGGSKEVFDVVKNLKKEQKESLLQYAVSWNTNSRNCHPAQVVMESVLSSHTPDELMTMSGLQKSVEGMLPYCQRHMSRVNSLAQAATFLDYTLSLMDITHRGITGEEKKEAEEICDESPQPPKKKRKKTKGIELLEPEIAPLQANSDDEEERTVMKHKKKHFK